jgi:hypothetical protein
VGLGGGGVGRGVLEVDIGVGHWVVNGGIEGGMGVGDGEEGYKINGDEVRVMTAGGKGVVEVVCELVLQGELAMIAAVEFAAEVLVFEGVGVSWVTAFTWSEFVISVSGVRRIPKQCAKRKLEGTEEAVAVGNKAGCFVLRFGGHEWVVFIDEGMGLLWM